MRRHVELAVGLGLLLGPLVFALTLPRGDDDGMVACELEPVAVVETRVEVPVVEPAPEPTVVEPEPTVVEPEPMLEGLAPAAVVLVAEQGLVLSVEARPEWGAGELYEPAGVATYRVAKPAAPLELPARLWAQRGRSFDLYDADGKVCSARVGELAVINQHDIGLDGVLGERVWDEFDGPENVPDQVWREALWQGEGHWLVGELVSDGDCTGALWARDAALPAPAILRSSDEPSAIGRARIAAFEASETYTQLRTDYRQWYAQLPPESLEWVEDWASMARENPASVRAWTDETGAARLVELEFGADTGDCGEGFAARVAMLDFVRGDGFVEAGHAADALAIFDADLDGKLEYLYAGWDVGERWVDSETIEVEYHVERDFECPC